MQNIKTSVVSAMRTSSALYSLISDRLFFHYPDTFITLPCVSYFEYDNSGSLFSDDVEIISEIIFQIDVWSSGSTSAIAQAIDTIMVSEDFVRLNSRDAYEKDTKIHHKSMKYVNQYSDPTF